MTKQIKVEAILCNDTSFCICEHCGNTTSRAANIRYTNGLPILCEPCADNLRTALNAYFYEQDTERASFKAAWPALIELGVLVMRAAELSATADHNAVECLTDAAFEYDINNERRRVWTEREPQIIAILQWLAYFLKERAARQATVVTKTER